MEILYVTANLYDHDKGLFKLDKKEKEKMAAQWTQLSRSCNIGDKGLIK